MSTLREKGYYAPTINTLDSNGLHRRMQRVCENNRETLTFQRGSFGFVVHPRDMLDISRQFPLLGALSNLNEEEAHAAFEELDPFVVCNFLGLRTQQGVHLPGFLLCAPFTPERAMNDLRFAQKQIIKTAKLAKEELGIKILGLGEFTGMLTHFGKDIESEVPGLYATSGHGYTTYIIGETLAEAARIKGDNLKQSTLAIVGAAGSIGSISAQLHKDKVRELILIDKTGNGRLEKLERDLAENGIKVTSSHDLNLLRRANYVICATTSAQPIIFAEHLSPGTIIVDDSQPINISREEAKKARSLVFHVVANTPEIQRTFDYGLPPGCDWACVAETMALSATEEWEKRTIGPVKLENVIMIGDLCKQVGFGPAPLQSFGKLVTDQEFANIK